MAGDNANFMDLLKKSIQICMPDLRHYYRMTKKAKVVAVYPSNGTYYADVQPLRNDESPDPKEPVVPNVPIPVLWGGSDRGVVCPPSVGVLCDLSYYDGDPNYPFISNIRWGMGMNAPCAELNEFVIQLENGVEFRIDKGKNIVTLSPADWKVEVGGNASIKAGGNATLEAGGNATVQAAGTLTLQAPQIVKKGNETGMGADGGTGSVTENANRTQTGSLTINGPVRINGSLAVSGGIDGKVNGCSGC